MAQIQSPETYVDGQQVTAARLNNQTNGAILLPGAITDQTALTANTVAAGDTVLLHDASDADLRKATAGDLLGSGLPVKTGAITGNSGADIVLTPAAGQKVDIAGNLEADDINVTDDLTVSGDLVVTGPSTLTGGITGNLTVGGLVTASGAPTLGNHLANKTYVDGGVSKTADGYVTLPNGLIIKWGFYSGNPVSSNITTTFSTAFPAACLNVSLTLSTAYAGVQSGKALTLMVTSKSSTQFVVNATGLNTASSDGFYWMAIGY
jgi:hypothetical protein